MSESTSVPPSSPPPASSGPASAAGARPRRGGQLRHHARFHSRGLRGCRDIVVWLPPGYGDPRRRHPVVYFQDGQNVFDPVTAFLGQAWMAGEAAEKLIRRRALVPPIMVGIYNTGFNRMNEYSPTRAEFEGWSGEKCRSTGDAKRYAKFVAQELKPFIDARYLTLPGPRTTSVVGSSMGGLVSLYFALWHPRVFGNVAALSPSLWWDDRIVFRDFGRLPRKLDVRIWLDTGTAEPGWEAAPLFRDALIGRGWTLGRDLAYREIAGATHNEKAWAARIGDVLQFLVGRGQAHPSRPAAPRKNARPPALRHPDGSPPGPAAPAP